ncbi:helicase-related protein [Rhodococcus aetherivorans]|uniref:helicase-related protein n=1 Tax=Rhodococcus aetherivorans TaxID=191292 RepID=UPI00367A2B56
MTGVEARAIMEAAVRRELFGPPSGESPRGKPLDCSSGKVHFDKREDSWGLWHEASTGQEILTESDPLRRYGIGILFSGAAGRGTAIAERSTGSADDGGDDIAGITGLSASGEILAGPAVEIEVKGNIPARGEADGDDFDLTDANSFKPSAMAISFQCEIAAGGSLAVTLTGAYYDRISANFPGLRRPRTWWVRRPFELTGTVPGTVLLNETNRLKTIALSPTNDLRVTPSLQVFSRPVPGHPPGSLLRLVTLAALNTAPGSGPSAALFQMGFRATPGNGLRITPYPDSEQHDPDEEEQSIALLYRNQRTYAIGHGCAADWTVGAEQVASEVRADPLPAHEVVSLTPDIYVTAKDGSREAVTVSMDELAKGTATGRAQVEAVLGLYEQWITDRENEISSLAPQLKSAAERHMRLCREALERMRAGWELATTDSNAGRAFRLANQAMFYQQIRTDFARREVERLKDGRLRVPTPHPTPTAKPGRGNWRPFQIAFLLATLPELVDRSLPSRSIVDLIFFPTGGGKTEAYLGASAISLLARRLHDKEDAGTDTLMRYTLRLLTAQQFLRAATLVCVLEDIRSENEDALGTTQFGIGIWLGGTSTPNTWDQAVENLRQLRRDNFAQNKFLLLRCPWCGTEMGPKPKAKGGQDIIGYEQVGKKVEFRCLDTACRFGGRRKLPIHVVDQDIYDTRPSIVIGTVDKFAMMAWRTDARNIFGLGTDGAREVSPPGLIIQDELHLISGPLGSMVGLYEPVVEDLCTDKRGEPVPPKIIASTATIRRYEDQIRGVFGREQVALFPPQGLEEGHSFFAEPATLENGELEPGRRYLGVMSASLGSTQTVQVRVAAATLQGALSIPEDDRDGYWTNLNFLNSLRELGNTVSLIQSDIPDYLTGLRRRENLDSVRWPRIPMELTSRRRSDDIPKAIEQLQLQCKEPNAVDICLASNIIEVGVDINRLGLMTIVGQPKTTAQYIQVSGRVGRRADRSPGLVITIYGAAKPRDRSHYERFHTYHQQLYAQVEPTSVTPFATPVLRRAMHAVAVSHIRQVSDQGLPVYPFPEEEFKTAIDLLRARANVADPGELPALERVQRKLAVQWDSWERTNWNANINGGDPKQGLMRYAGTLPDLKAQATMWDVPTSMRNVDAECRLEISLDYNREEAAAAEEDEE